MWYCEKCNEKFVEPGNWNANTKRFLCINCLSPLVEQTENEPLKDENNRLQSYSLYSWLFRFLTGRTAYAPMWMNKLPKFMIPVYQGNNSFKWFGKSFVFDESVDTWGKTLFMVWRDQREAK